MSSLLATKIAQRYLLARRGEAFVSIISVVSVLGVAIGVAVLCIVMSVMGGFEHELRAKVLGANSHILVRPLASLLPDWQQLSEKTEKVSGVKSVSPYTYSQGLLRTERVASGALVRGIRSHDASGEQVQGYLPKGQMLSDALAFQRSEEGAPLPPIIIGAEMASILNVGRGSIVTMLSPSVSSSPFGLIPRTKRFVVSAIYRSGLSEYEASVVYVSMEVAQAFFQLGSAVSGLEIRVDDVRKAPEIGELVSAALGGADGGIFVKPWTETNAQLWEAIQLEKRVYFLVLLLIVVMASFSIITTLVMIVLEKRHDIASLMVLGASPSFVARIFRAQGTVIGGIGVVLGLLLGSGGCWALKAYGFPLNEKVFQLATVPVRAEPANFAIIGIVAFGICYLATIYPAWRAASIRPAELLRS